MSMISEFLVACIWSTAKKFISRNLSSEYTSKGLRHFDSTLVSKGNILVCGLAFISTV
jgi:hypothetical protein